MTLISKLILYGVFGWCCEILWTAAYKVGSDLRHRRALDPRLVGTTYLWMLPIYGGGGLLFEVVHGAISPWSWWLRALVYAGGCFAVEAASGWGIQRVTGKIPWDYSYTRWHVRGLIRLDYLPVWMVFGLALEIYERFARQAAPLILP